MYMYVYVYMLYNVVYYGNMRVYPYLYISLS